MCLINCDTYFTNFIMVELQKVKVSTVAKKQMAEKSLKTECLFAPPN